MPPSGPHGQCTSTREVLKGALSLCCLHHAAYDGFLIGISPNFTVSVQPSALRESDGVMLRHGLQDLDGKEILLPNKEAFWPDRDGLAYRYDLFRSSGKSVRDETSTDTVNPSNSMAS